MICPNCGSEVSGEVCVTCGARVKGSSGFNLQGMNAGDIGDINKYGTGPAGAGNMSGMQDDFSDMEDTPFVVNQATATSDTISGNTKKGFNKLIAMIPVIIVVVAVAAVLFVNLVLWRVDSGYKDVVDKFFASIERTDSAAMAECFDADEISDDAMESVESLYTSLASLTSLGMTIEMDYTIGDYKKLSKDQREAYMPGFDDDYLKKVHVAILCDVSYTMSVSYAGMSESQDDEQQMILYKYGGDWYMYSYDLLGE